jgi:hypothetical protein
MESMRRLWWYPFGATAGHAGRNVRGGIRPRKRGTAVFVSLDEIIGGHFPMWPDAPDERFRKTVARISPLRSTMSGREVAFCAVARWEP